MLVDSLIVPECVYRPGSFSGLMTIYESNYLKFDRLLGHEPPRKHRVSVTPDDCDLHLEVLSSERYTSTLKLTYWFEEEGFGLGEGSGTASASNAASGVPSTASVRLIPDPDLTVRVYHDAALVEAVGGRNTHHHHVLRALALPDAGEELDRRWRVNVMLNKWLDYLLDNGHSLV